MGVKAEGMLMFARVNKVTSTSLGYPLSVLNKNSTLILQARVPGLPIRDCARGCTNRGQSRPIMSAIDVTAKTFFERLYLVLGLRKIAP